MRRASIVILSLLSLLFASSSGAQPERPPVADPFYGFWVDGRVLRADGTPVEGAEVLRTSGIDGRAPYSAGTFLTRTDREGAFRFSFRGFGWGGPREWFLRARVDGCERVVRVILREAPLPPNGDREGDVARGVEIRLPRCAP